MEPYAVAAILAAHIQIDNFATIAHEGMDSVAFVLLAAEPVNLVEADALGN
jgi:hypothetical protein